jgi:hypothetical protein
MALLVTVGELALWAEGSRTAISPADQLANWILEQASTLVADECGHPEWTEQTAPVRAKIVIANIAKRCWNNSDQVTREAIAGGPSQNLLDEAALGLRLSDAEIIECAKITEALAPVSATGGLWVLPTTRGPVESNMIVPDSAWPASSPMVFMTPDVEPEYFPTVDAELPIDGPDAEQTNTLGPLEFPKATR